MSRYYLKEDELGACSICDHCIDYRYPKFYCGEGNDNFGDIDYPEECDDFEYCEDDEEY